VVGFMDGRGFIRPDVWGLHIVMYHQLYNHVMFLLLTNDFLGSVQSRIEPTWKLTGVSTKYSSTKFQLGCMSTGIFNKNYCCYMLIPQGVQYFNLLICETNWCLLVDSTISCWINLDFLRPTQPCSIVVEDLLLLMLHTETVWIDIDWLCCVVGDNVQTSLGVFLYHVRVAFVVRKKLKGEGYVLCNFS